MLTDKTKIEFEKWFDNNYSDYKNYYDSKPTLLNAIIIEWFDSVGIYINILKYNDKWKMIVNTQFRYIFNSRTEATKKAIEKANEIFNI